MLTEREKMLAGELYDPSDPDLTEARLIARQHCHTFNQSSPLEEETRRDVLTKLLAGGGESAWIEPPFRCDYGFNIHLGRKVYVNFDCVVLDVCEVRIGNNVLIAPGVHIYTATHPLDSETRRSLEFGKPVTIGDDVWIGGKSVVCPGVSIGERSVIGAGSVVTKDVPAGVLLAGNPAQVIRELTTSQNR